MFPRMQHTVIKGCCFTAQALRTNIERPVRLYNVAMEAFAGNRCHCRPKSAKSFVKTQDGMSFVGSKPSPCLTYCPSRRELVRQLVTTTCCTKHADDKQPRRLCSYQPPSWFSCKSLITAGAALALAVSSAVAAEDLTITFNASRDPEIRKVQMSLVEAWGECTTRCFQSHNGLLTRLAD